MDKKCRFIGCMVYHNSIKILFRNFDLDMTQEDKQYLKDHLKIQWLYDNGDLYIALLFDGEVISRIPFAQD